MSEKNATEAARVQPWLATLLASLEVSGLEASFSGGGDEGDLNDIAFVMSDGAERTSCDVWNRLASEKLRSPLGASISFLDALVEQLDAHASELGDYCNGDGGSAWLKLSVKPGRMLIVESEFVPGEPDYDDDWEPDEPI